MASPCIITFEGKKYSFEEYASMLHDGLLDQMVQDGIVDDSRFKKMAEQVERTEFDNDEDYELYAISKETDPNVIADKYFRLPELDQTDYKEYQLVQAILGKKPYQVSLKEWNEYGGDISNPSELREYKKFIKQGKGDIDDVAGILTDRFGVEVTPEDIVETIINYGNKSEFNRKKVSNVEQALLERYYDLTGKKTIPKAVAKKGFETVNKKSESGRKAAVSKERLEEIGVTEEDIARQKEFEETGFGELETPLEKYEYQKKQVSRKGKTKLEIAKEKAEKSKQMLRDLGALDSIVTPIDVNDTYEATGKAKEYLAKVTPVLNELFPNLTIKVYNTRSEYEKATGRPAMSAGSFHRDSSTIALNLELIEKYGAYKTFLHEAIHPIVDAVFLSNPKLREAAIKDIRSIRGVPGMNRVFEHMSSYKDRTKEIWETEGITEFVTLIANGDIDLANFEPNLFTRVKEVFNRIMEYMGSDFRIETAGDIFLLSARIKEAFDAQSAEPIKKTLSTVKGVAIDLSKENELLQSAKISLDNLINDRKSDANEIAKVLKLYHQDLVDVAKSYIKEISDLNLSNVKPNINEFAENIGESVTDRIKDAWNEAIGKSKKRLSDFIPEAEKIQEKKEKERLRKEDLGLVTPKLEDYASEEPVSVSKDFESLVFQASVSDEFRDTLSNKERESGKILTRAEKRYQVNPLMAAFELGENIVAKAKEEFGDTYVNDLLSYVEKNQNTLGVDKVSLILLSLENDLNRQQLIDPENLTLAKQEKMIQNIAIAYLRSAARAIGYGRLRRIARVGYDVDEVTSQLFSSEQVERRRKVEKAMESTADDINDEAELQEQETEGELVIEEPKVKRDAKQVKSDIKAVIAQMKADLVKSARGAGGALSAIPYAQQIKDVSPHVVKLSKLFAELGGMKAKEIVAEIRKSIKDIAPDVKESDIVDILKLQQKSPKNTKDRLEQAKDRVKARIEELQQEIADKRKELKIVNKVKSDAELDALLEQEKALKDIARQYLTQESIDRINESKEKAIVTKLENEIANLDEQITNQQKIQKAKPTPVTSLEITLLRAQRKAKMDVLNDLDPNPKAFTQQALIDAGYGREITVTTKQGKEQRQVLDWKKLAGKEMDVTAIQNIVEQALKDKGFTPAQISRMQYAFVQEFTNLRASVIDKSLKALRQMNEPKKASERKSSAKRLAELFDLGLFDQNSDEFDYLINKAIGLSDIGQEAFFEAKKLSESLKEIYSMNSNEFFTRQFIREINLKVSKLLNKVAFNEGNNWYRVTSVVSELMNLGLRTKLQTLKQFFDNQISGRQERLIQDIGTMFQKGTDTKELKKLRSKYASLIKDDITKNAGLYFGEVNSPFLTKSQIEDYINSRTDNQFYHLVVSSMLGKSYLEGADSMNKADSTEKFFISMLLKVMTDKSNPNRMTPEEALQFVNEQLTGQKFEDALKESEKIINQINTQAGKIVLANTKQNIFRGAMDLVKANLLVGQVLDANTIESAYNAAYTSAGYGLGHEANNIVSETVNQVQSRLEEKIKKAVKEKEWSRAANLTIIATINRNIINPFVGGGTNWLVLGLQKSGLDVISPLYYMSFKMKNGIDLSTDAGVKKLEETLIADYRSKTINRRFLIGGLSASLITLGLFASGGDDEMEEWLKKNEWARKYQTVFVPQLTLLAMSIKNKTFGDWATETFSKSTKFEKLPKIKKGIEAYNKGDGGEADEAKLYGVLGNVAGSFVDAPLLPVRFARDLGGVYRYIVDKPQEKPDFKNVGFANGFFNYGLIDYLGFRPDRTYMKDMEEYIPESDVKTIKFLRKNDLEINSNSDKAVLSNGIKKSLTEEESQKYDMSFGEEAYRIMKEAINKYDDITEDQLKSLKKTAEFIATEKAQSELNIEDASLQQLEIDGVKYTLTEGQIKKRKSFIREYIKENRQKPKFQDRYKEAVKDGKILNMPESKRRMLMESAEASATRQIKELLENKTSLLEKAPK